VFTLTTRFAYDGDGARRTVEVVGHGTTTYTLDYGRGNHILAETMPASTVMYLYGHDCLGELRDDEWLYYLNDGVGYVRQGADESGQVVSSWLFDPDGTVLEGPNGPVSHLICGGVYDWSTGLVHRDGRYFDPMLGIWLALAPLVVVQSWRGRKRKRGGMPWYVLLLVVVSTGCVLTACGSDEWDRDFKDFCIDIPQGFEEPPGWEPEARASREVRIESYQGPHRLESSPSNLFQFKFEWSVKFHVDSAEGPPPYGWIVQEVEILVEPASTDTAPVHEKYWEAWEVPAGETRPLDINGEEWDDNFSNTLYNPAGKDTTRGLVKYYEAAKVDGIASGVPGQTFHKKAPGEKDRSGGLWVSYVLPEFWDFTGTVHNLAVVWDKDRDPVGGYCAQYGSQTLSGGF
jgi:hypothetical protein